MGYQSKTYSLSDEVVEQIDAAREKGITPNQFLKALIFGEPWSPVSPPAGSKVGKANVETYRVGKPPLLKPKDRKG